jgi:hypothetical protein
MRSGKSLALASWVNLSQVVMATKTNDRAAEQCPEIITRERREYPDDIYVHAVHSIEAHIQKGREVLFRNEQHDGVSRQSSTAGG